jgi:two-component system, sensor histidine kinase and response regulator
MKRDTKSSAAITILYAEDHKDTRDALGATLARCFPAARVLLAENGSVGLALFKRDRPEIVITDIDMPVLDGITMCSVIMDLAPETAIIVLSGCRDARRLLRDMEPGVSHFVPKPIDFDRLFPVIAASLARITLAREAGGVSPEFTVCA